MHQRSMMSHLALLALVGTGCAEPLPGSATDGATSLDSGSSDGLGSSSAAPGSETGPICGNGIVEAGEICDDAGQSATCDIDCTDVVCGDGMINASAGEECEDGDLADATCESLGFDVGALSYADGCSYDTSECCRIPAVPLLGLSFSQVKQFDFSWAAVEDAEYYQLLESAAFGEPFVLVDDAILGGGLGFSLTTPLHFRFDASYALRACSSCGCTDSPPVAVSEALTEAIGYFKASNTWQDDLFGSSVALSGDGNTLAVGAVYEDSSATGVDGNQGDGTAPEAGAVYVFGRDATGNWSQQAYIKASNAESADHFGNKVALSDDGDTLAVGAVYEWSSAIGIGGDENDDGAETSGAAYIFTRDATEQWSQQAYIKASNTGQFDNFGRDLALSGDGDTLAVGAIEEDGSGVDGDQADNSVYGSGAVYVFIRDDADEWSQQAYVKAPDPGEGDYFGWSLALSDEGDTLAVGAVYDDGTNDDPDAMDAGSAHVFGRDAMGQWSHQAYIQPANIDAVDQFGWSVALSGDGDTLAVGAHGEDGSATGINGVDDDGLTNPGAAYVFALDGAGVWQPQAYVKASNTQWGYYFGWSVALSSGGDVLAVGSYFENSGAIGLDGDQYDVSESGAGAVYVYVRDAMDQWSHRSYVKASNAGTSDHFGGSIALSSDGGVLAVGAHEEDSGAVGIGGDQTDESHSNAGAVYLYPSVA